MDGTGTPSGGSSSWLGCPARRFLHDSKAYRVSAPDGLTPLQGAQSYIEAAGCSGIDLAKDWQPAALGAIVESMRCSREELQKLATTFKTSAWQPPQSALYAFASLLAEEALTQAIAESFTEESRTVWVLTGITYTSLIRVRASSKRNHWSWQEPGSDDEQRGEDLAATRWPLSAVRSLNVARVSDMTGQGDSTFEWGADWVLTLLGGETISVPASKVAPSQAEAERVESLIAAIRWRM